MIVLVTGASGFIGRPLVGRLLASGHTLRILTRNASVTQAFHWPAGGPFPDAALEGVEAVLHLAGENIGVWPWTTARKRRILDSRVLGTRALVEAMGRQSKPPRIFVAASAMGYYGQTGTVLCNEARAPGQGFLAEVVHAWEAEIFKAQALGIRTVAVRNGLVLGIGYDGSGPAGALGKMLPSFRLGLGAILGTGKQYWSWIHLEDSVQIFMHALANANVVGALNACAPEPVTQAEFSRSLALALGRPRWLRVPAFALKMGLGSMADTLLEGQRGDPGKLLASGYRFQYTSLAQALKALLAAEHPGRKEGDTHAGE